MNHIESAVNQITKGLIGTKDPLEVTAIEATSHKIAENPTESRVKITEPVGVKVKSEDTSKASSEIVSAITNSNLLSI